MTGREAESKTDDDDALAGARVAFTGRLASMIQEKAEAIVRERGGAVDAFPNEDTTHIVIGNAGWPLSEDGRLTRKLEAARDLQSNGCTIAIISEDEFLVRARLREETGNVERLFTIDQLSRILELPRQALRRWMRHGLIRPVKTVHRLAYFDFAQVARAKTMARFLKSGISSARLRRSLRQLEIWLPEAATDPLARLPLVERDGDLLVRLDDGRLAQPNGQLLFDFLDDDPDGGEPDGGKSGGSHGPHGTGGAGGAGGADGKSSSDPVSGPTTIAFERKPRTVEEWFDAALRLEDAGQFAQAAEAYQEALLLGGPQSEICFNLANVLYTCGRLEPAAERYRQAVEADSSYVEAWNNLGNVLTELRRFDEATRAFETALEIEPDYADAHYNFAETLAESGDLERARHHWREYLARDAESSWAEHVRERLGET